MALTTVGLWFVFLVVFADTPLSLWRGMWQRTEAVAQAEQPGQIPLRVISLNAHGSSRAIAALERWQPDLILIQETPGAGTLREVGQAMLGENSGMLAGVDASILSRAPLEPLASSVNYTIGKVSIKPGQEVLVVSLRLTPPPFRADLWNPECWRAYRDQRIHQRDELRQLSRRLAELSTDLPVIVGGDFNVNPRDPIFRELPANLRDAFSRQVSAGEIRSPTKPRSCELTRCGSTIFSNLYRSFPRSPATPIIASCWRICFSQQCPSSL